MDRRWQAGRFRTDLYGRLYRTGEVYITFRVETAAGKAEAELRVDVLELTPPVISLALPAEGSGSAGCRIYLHSRYSAFGPGGLPLPMALCRRGRFYADELYLPGRGGGELPDPYRGIERRRNLLQGICRGGRGEDAFGGPLRKALITAKRPIGARSSAVRSILRRRWLISPIRSSSGRLMGNRS